VPEGFSVVGRTATCAVAAVAAPARNLYAVQFHPEVVHTRRGKELLANFVFRICNAVKDWDARHRAPLIEQEIRECAGARKVFFFVSGGVDSSVAFTLCMRALGEDRVRGVYVDTGLMRAGETDFVRRMAGVSVEAAQEQFLNALAGVIDPEQKRHIIGEEFVRVQERVIEGRRLLDEQWILGQGTIYPDTIESGGTKKAALIKTHHNRVAGIQKLIETGRIVEPLKSPSPPNCWTGTPSRAPAWRSGASARSSTRPSAKPRMDGCCRCTRSGCKETRAATRLSCASIDWTTPTRPI
jgi:GMP synthase (glutamine-hydrolysing)